MGLSPAILGLYGFIWSCLRLSWACLGLFWSVLGRLDAILDHLRPLLGLKTPQKGPKRASRERKRAQDSHKMPQKCSKRAQDEPTWAKMGQDGFQGSSGYGFGAILWSILEPQNLLSFCCFGGKLLDKFLNISWTILRHFGGPFLEPDRPKRGQDEPKKAMKTVKGPKTCICKNLEKQLVFQGFWGLRLSKTRSESPGRLPRGT